MGQAKSLSAMAVCLAVVSLAAAGLYAGNAEAGISALNPTDDTYVSSLAALRDTNFNSPNDNEVEILVHSSSPPLTAFYIGYLRFDLSGLTPAQVQNVWLRVYEQLAADSSVTISLYKTASNDWNGSGSGTGDADDLTYNNAPAADGDALATITGDGSGRWWVFQSTALMQYILDHLPGGSVGDGLATFRLEATGTGASQLCSFEDVENGGGTGNLPELSFIPPPVDVASFTATPGEGKIQIAWTTTREDGISGFNLYRALKPDGLDRGTAVQLNQGLIPADGGPIQGSSYKFPDDSVVPGVRHYYWLETVEDGGSEGLYGPVSAILEVWHIYLPILLRN